MAGSKSNYLENKVLNLLLGNVSYTIPTTLYVGLWDSSDGTLTDASTGASAGEISGNGYSRAAVANDTTTWGTATTDSTRRNAIEISFPTATGAWGSTSVDQMAILDASSGGNILFWADLGTPKIIGNGDSVKFGINDITVVEN